MKNTIERWCVFALLCCVAQHGSTEVNAVSVAPTMLQMNIATGLSTTVSWTVTFVNLEVESARGEFIGTRAVLATNAASIVLRPRRGDNAPRTETARDRVVVAPFTAQQWWDSGIRQVIYRRDFRDSRGDVVGARVQITLVNPSAPPTPIPTPPTPRPIPTPPTPTPIPTLPTPTPTPTPIPTPPTPTPIPTPPTPTPIPPEPTTPNPESPPLTPNPQAPIMLATPQGLHQLRDIQSADLVLRRLELSFTDLKIVKFVDQGDQLTARLRVSYSGSGVLRGRWMLAGPTSTVGTPRFRSWTVVNAQLSGSQRTELFSPLLPTDTPGRYYLQFCASGELASPLDIDPDAACPNELISTTVGYQVFPRRASVERLEGLSPAGGDITASTVFSWLPVENATLYQIQILTAQKASLQSQPNQLLDSHKLQFVGGLVLPGSVTNTTLSDAVLTRMTAQENYYWRVTAYDIAGRLVASSQAQLLSFVRKEPAQVLENE